MSDEPLRAVFDCVIFAQALINPKGPAGGCIKAAERALCLVAVSSFVLQEVRELASKLPIHYGVTSDRIELFIQQLSEYANFVPDVPHRYDHPIDPGDSHYVDLALATGCELIVSRDRHLLALMDSTTVEGADFMRAFPSLRVVQPVEFLQLVSANY